LKRALYVFYIASFMLGLVGGSYYTVSRNAVYAEEGLDYGFISTLVAFETIPGFFSIVGGAASDVLGRRRMLLLGASSSIPLILAGFSGLRLLPPLILVYGVLTSTASPSIAGGLLHYTNSSGSAYSVMAVANSIGWALGGILGGYLAALSPFTNSMILLGALVAVSYLVLYSAYPREVMYPGARLREVAEGARRVWLLFLASTLVFTGTRFFFSSYILNIRSMLGDPVLFGLVVNTLPALTGALLWYYIGRLSDRVNPVYLALAAIVEYIVFIVLFLNIYDPVIVSALWVVPIYPLLEQGLVISISRRLPGRLQSLASGVYTTSTSLAGFTILVLAGVITDLRGIGAVSIAVLLAGLALTYKARA